MIRTLMIVCCAAAALAGAAQTEDHKLPPAGAATAYPAVDIDKDNHVAIAAEPFESPEKEKIFRVDYMKAGFLPIRIIVTNDGDRPISLNDARIDLIAADGEKIPAAEPEDIERRMTRLSNPGTTIPLPTPLPRIHGKTKTPDKKIEADFAEFEYGAIAVEPHTTRAGFLWYDLQGLGENPLRGAKLDFRELRDANGKEMFSFDVPFDKYLDAQKGLQ